MISKLEYQRLYRLDRREYYRLYKLEKNKRWKEPPVPPVITPPLLNEVVPRIDPAETVVGNLDGERSYCFTFGCGKQLSLIESLAGKVCTDCMAKNLAGNMQ